MGMDVYGKNPTSEAGAYFRNNVWWWRPLADFLCDRYPDVTAGCEYWHTNDGDGLDAEASTRLAELLRADLAAGLVAEYARAYDERLAALPDEECWLCAGSGVRTDEVGRRLGLDQPRDAQTGRGGCNGCEGRGKTRPSAASYPFSVDNVTEFAAFVEHCGGFAIC